MSTTTTTPPRDAARPRARAGPRRRRAAPPCRAPPAAAAHGTPPRDLRGVPRDLAGRHPRWPGQAPFLPSPGRCGTRSCGPTPTTRSAPGSTGSCAVSRTTTSGSTCCEPAADRRRRRGGDRRRRAARALMGTIRSSGSPLEPYLNFLRSLPPLGYIGLLIVWFGIGDTSKIWLLFLAAFPPIAMATIAASAACARTRSTPPSARRPPRQTIRRSSCRPRCPRSSTASGSPSGSPGPRVVAAEIANGIPGIGGLAYVSGAAARERPRRRMHRRHRSAPPSRSTSACAASSASSSPGGARPELHRRTPSAPPLPIPTTTTTSITAAVTPGGPVKTPSHHRRLVGAAAVTAILALASAAAWSPAASSTAAPPRATRLPLDAGRVHRHHRAHRLAGGSPTPTSWSRTSACSRPACRTPTSAGSRWPPAATSSATTRPGRSTSG